MKRRNFLKKSCMACITGLSMVEIITSCNASKHITGKIVDSDLVVPISDFLVSNEIPLKYKKNIIIQQEDLKYPICVFRHAENDFSALWMNCTHLGAELQVFGDVLQCPAHGSEFSHRGKVLSPPAISDLRSFPVKIENGYLHISLKA